MVTTKPRHYFELVAFQVFLTWGNRKSSERPLAIVLPLQKRQKCRLAAAASRHFGQEISEK